MKKQFITFLCFASLVLLLSSCAGYSAVGRWVASDSSRRTQLEKRVSIWHQAIFWADKKSALSVIEPSLEYPLNKIIKKVDRSEEFREFTVESMVLNDDATATVKSTVKSFKVPSYKLESRVITENWTYRRFGGGWFLSSSDLLEDKLL
ncbi:MAG: hypothetical protein IT292_11180 [Deltaproteobacteria bacterium]|nr:hypothetical protein [Deltaproteobacteria bacterium]